jgi:D-arabinose 1-dehydrogenase-like Zn-dependent alcohol dehydrogenase
MCSGITAYGALKRLADRPRQRNLLLIGLGGVGMMGWRSRKSCSSRRSRSQT